MTTDAIPQVDTAEIVVPCTELDATLPFFKDTLGFRVDAIFPADDPAIAVVSGHGVRLRLERGAQGDPGALRLLCADPVAGARELTAPNGTRIELVAADPPLDIPPLKESLVIAKMGADAEFGAGRAGMGYRDLIPDRLGGRFIASHIRIPDAGPVPDNVHFHKVRFQMIYCYKGWVKVAYEDQGEPMIMKAGDCFLQPPEIRHRVLECSAGLEVVEIGCPADHMTCLDHDMPLPTGKTLPDRDYGGQRFVFHQAEKAGWGPWRLDGFEARDLGIGAATDGLAGVRVARVSGTPAQEVTAHDAEFLFTFVLEGKVKLDAEGHDATELGPADSFVVPSDLNHALVDPSDDLELLEVALPDGFATTRVGG